MPTFFDGIEGKDAVKDWVKNGPNQAMINWCKEFGKYLATKVDGKELATNQIRNIFSEVRRIQLQLQKDSNVFRERDLILLIPKLAYVSAKSKNTKAGDLEIVLKEGINIVLNANNKQIAFENFVNFFEAILAYHKAFEA